MKARDWSNSKRPPESCFEGFHGIIECGLEPLESCLEAVEGILKWLQRALESCLEAIEDWLSSHVLRRFRAFYYAVFGLSSHVLRPSNASSPSALPATCRTSHGLRDDTRFGCMWRGLWTSCSRIRVLMCIVTLLAVRTCSACCSQPHSIDQLSDAREAILRLPSHQPSFVVIVATYSPCG